MLPQIYSHENSKHDNLDEWNCRFWGVCCESGKKYSQVVSRRFKLTMAALDPESYQGGSPYVSVVLERDGAEYLLCSLKHEHILQVNLNLVFESGQNVTFSLKGDGIVHLSGYQDGNCVKLSVKDQKGNAENNPSTLGKAMKNGRIYCEICDAFIKSQPMWEEHIKKKKHKRNTDEFMKARVLSSNPIIEVKATPTKNENPVIDLEKGTGSGKKGKSSSSLKSDVRNMPSTSKAGDSEDSSEIEELSACIPSSSGKVGTSGFEVESLLSKSLVKTLNEITDDDDDEEDEDFNVLDAEEESDDDEEDSGDDDEDDDDDSDNSGDIIDKTLEAQKRKRESEASGNRKRMKNNSMSEASTSEASQTPIEIFEVDDKESSSSSEEESDSSMDASSSFKQSPLLKKEQVFNKKKKMNDGVNQLDTNSVRKNDTVHIQDIRPGYGPPAKAGKMVQVYYVGKFLDGKIFDQTENGKPFSFKLGAGQVIKGWDTGIEGMKVGGKRMLKIPPSMGYGSQPTDDIPANSTLIFNVELKSIS